MQIYTGKIISIKKGNKKLISAVYYAKLGGGWFRASYKLPSGSSVALGLAEASEPTEREKFLYNIYGPLWM